MFCASKTLFLILTIFSSFVIMALGADGVVSKPVLEFKLTDFFNKSEIEVSKEIGEKQKEIEPLEKELSFVNKGKVRPQAKKTGRFELKNNVVRFVFKTKEDKEKAISELDEKIAEIKKSIEAIRKSPPTPSLFVHTPLAVGQVGICPKLEKYRAPETQKDYLMPINYLVQQVMSENEFLCRITRFRPTFRRNLNNPRDLTIYPGPAKKKPGMLVIFNKPTTGLVDNRVADLSGYYKVSGTKTYSTAIGSTNTVFVVEPFDITPFFPSQEKINSSNQTREEAATDESDTKKQNVKNKNGLRIWKSKSSDNTVKAVFLKRKGNKIELEKEDGKVITVPIAKLSEEDQTYLQSIED